jgi:hypothetical protein
LRCKGSEKIATHTVLTKNLVHEGQKMAGKKKRCREVCALQKNVVLLHRFFEYEQIGNTPP